MKSQVVFKLINIAFISVIVFVMSFFFLFIVFDLTMFISLSIAFGITSVITVIEVFKNFIINKKTKYDYQNTNNDFNNHELPTFAYIFDNNKFFKLNTKFEKCQCCKEVNKYIYDGPFYSEEEVEVLCPNCIASGKASSKFDGIFNEVGNEDLSKKSIELVTKMTPAVNSWQSYEWIDCCGELCQLYGILTWYEVRKLQIEDEVTKAIKMNEDYKFLGLSFNELKDEINDGNINLIVFRCFNCDKFHVIFDFD